MTPTEKLNQRLTQAAMLIRDGVAELPWYAEYRNRTAGEKKDILTDEYGIGSNAFIHIRTEDVSIEVFGGDRMIIRTNDGKWSLMTWYQVWNRDNGDGDSDYKTVSTHHTLEEATIALLKYDAEEAIADFLENRSLREYALENGCLVEAVAEEAPDYTEDDCRTSEWPTAECADCPPNHGM